MHGIQYKSKHTCDCVHVQIVRYNYIIYQQTKEVVQN